MKNSLSGKNTEELAKILKEKDEALRSFRFGLSGGKTRNVREGRAIRKTIAKAHTELRKGNTN